MVVKVNPTSEPFDGTNIATIPNNLEDIGPARKRRKTELGSLKGLVTIFEVLLMLAAWWECGCQKRGRGHFVKPFDPIVLLSLITEFEKRSLKGGCCHQP